MAAASAGRRLQWPLHADRVLFTDRVPDGFSADVLLSLSAFEHYADPGGELRRMASLVRSDGVILLAFAEPWYSTNGSHVNQFTRFPFSQQSFAWLNLFVLDGAMLRLRRRYRPDRATGRHLGRAQQNDSREV
jgi:hypothetical protein